MRNKNGLLLAAMGVVAALAASSGASAETRWDKTHPRRVEVNHRLAVQAHRIHVERREGELSPRKAAMLHRQDRRIRHEERQMASLDKGHITRADQRALNQQENHVSREIAR